MECRSFVFDVVGDLDLEPISPVALYGWTREVVVDQKTWDRNAIWRAVAFRYRPVVIPGYASIGCRRVVVSIAGSGGSPRIALGQWIVAQKVRQRLLLRRAEDGQGCIR